MPVPGRGICVLAWGPPLYSDRNSLYSMATVTDLLNEIKEQLNALDEDAAKVDKGQKAAGTRVRKGLQEVKKSCDSLRKHILSLRE